MTKYEWTPEGPKQPVMTNKRECGCKVGVIDDQKPYANLADSRENHQRPIIKYCSTHALAFEMLEALEDLLNHGLVYESGEVHEADTDKAKELIKRAKGE